MLRLRLATAIGFASLLWPQPAPHPVESLPTLRITVTLVQVDVVATDSRGRRVTDLGAADFEILQDGKPQPIKAFLWNPAPPPLPAMEEPAGLTPRPVTSGQIQRTVALVVDDLSLGFEHIARVRDALRRFIDRQIRPGDLVAIVRTGGGVVALEQFTTDRRMLRAAVDLLKWRFTARCGVNPISGLEGSNQPQALDYGCSYSALGTIGTLEHVIRGMQPMPGRKSIVLLSNSLRIPASLNSSMNRLTDLANRSAVSIYAVDPEGLSVKGLAAVPEPQDDGEPPALAGAILGVPEADVRTMGDGLQYLTQRTGGLFYGNNNDIAGCIRGAADDQLGYYLLGYAPEEDTFALDDSGKRKFHKVTVRVRRPGVRVRWKTGFDGVPDELRLSEAKDALSTREQQLADALASPFSARGLNVRLTSMFTHLGKYGPAVRSMLHFDGKGLQFKPGPEGTWETTVDVVSVALRGVGLSFVQSERPQLIRLTEELYQRSLREGFLLHLPDVEMKEPGPFVLRAVVRDRNSGNLGSASQFLDVPDSRKKRFATTTIQLRLATPAMVRALTSGATEVPQEPDTPGLAEAVANGGPALRRYRPGQAILYGLLVLNPKLKGSPKSARVNTQVRLYRDGNLVYAGSATDVAQMRDLDGQRHLAGGLLQLGKRFAPGEYLLNIIARDLNQRGGKVQASQWIDFEVLADRGI